MRWWWVTGILFAALLLPACGSNPFAPPPPPPAGGLGLLGRPFNGVTSVTSMFDHDLPTQAEDRNGYILTYKGTITTIGQDGHDGYDWFLLRGTPIFAAAEGEVVFAGVAPPFFCALLGREVSDQLEVEIRHPAANGEVFTTVYAHLDRVDVQAGQKVSGGQQVGLSGNTGCSTGPHLHFQVTRMTGTNSGQPARVDPYGWQGSGQDPWAVHPRGARSVWLWKDGQAPPTAPF